MSEKQKLLLLVGAFLFAYWLPMDHPRVQGAVVEGFAMLGRLCKRTRPFVLSTRTLHCWGGIRLCAPGCGYALFGGGCAENDGLWSRVGVRGDFSGLLLYGIAFVCGHF